MIKIKKYSLWIFWISTRQDNGWNAINIFSPGRWIRRGVDTCSYWVRRQRMPRPGTTRFSKMGGRRLPAVRASSPGMEPAYTFAFETWPCCASSVVIFQILCQLGVSPPHSSNIPSKVKRRTIMKLHGCCTPTLPCCTNLLATHHPAVRLEPPISSVLGDPVGSCWEMAVYTAICFLRRSICSALMAFNPTHLFLYAPSFFFLSFFKLKFQLRWCTT